ncbi:uncharacterized protein LACBIDRAFT_325159 [Laccaria bicolor S238N-H82]|uniref:Predicted protein n=1 Tax=Laccaria bicolor (strain S238N-H82 / ATCC MYA-4686) TaxID=486041 RepID=B0D413_LACBS|nr:uncharacterized protein LACBIDRAFT_325159 [Laccaria bicolor S238N-H82]EDR10250.1 predicted protein [Laccaria bicolor S238N-H82]|eukprot:XP_001878700.1 predicted protein [Laccaria bicolor S238N-H82]
MLYVNILIYVLSFLEVQTIHLARRLRSYCGLIHHLAEGTRATVSKDRCKATPTNPGYALSIRLPTDISPVLASVFLISTLQNRKTGSLDLYVPDVKRGPSIIGSRKPITSHLAPRHQLTYPAKAWSISSPPAQETSPVSLMSDGGSTCYKQPHPEPADVPPHGAAKKWINTWRPSVVRSFQLALSRADILDETLGIEIIVYSIALVLCKIGDIFITLLLGFFVYFSIRKLVNNRAARPHLSPALHDFSSVLSLAYSLTIDAEMAGERVAPSILAACPPLLQTGSGKTPFPTDRSISVSNIGQVQTKTKPKRIKLQMEMHVPEGKSFPTLVNRDISKTLDYPDSKLATPDVDSTSRPLLPPEYTSPSSSPSTIENEEYLSSKNRLRDRRGGTGNNEERFQSISVDKSHRPLGEIYVAQYACCFEIMGVNVAWTLTTTIPPTPLILDPSLNPSLPSVFDDVGEDGFFKDAGVVIAGESNKSEIWERIIHSTYQDQDDLRIRALFIENMSGPILQMLGTRYNIEPFFFSSSLNWIPSRFQEEIREGEGDHITVTLTFLRSITAGTAVSLDAYASSETLRERPSVATQLLDTQAPLDLRSGQSVYWQNIFRKYEDPTFVLLVFIWHAIYAWDESLENLYSHICDLESRVMNTSEMDLTQELHIIRAHHLHYSSLLDNFRKTVEFIRDTLNPALESLSEEDRAESKEVMKRETHTLLSEIERLNKTRDMQDKRLKNVMNLVFSSVNIDDSKRMQRMTEASVRDSAAMKQIAYLTMIFLPASFVANIFSMNVHQIAPGTTATLPQFIEGAIPLTLATIWIIIAFQSKYIFPKNASFWTRLGWPILMLMRAFGRDPYAGQSEELPLGHFAK